MPPSHQPGGGVRGESGGEDDNSRDGSAPKGAVQHGRHCASFEGVSHHPVSHPGGRAGKGIDKRQDTEDVRGGELEVEVTLNEFFNLHRDAYIVVRRDTSETWYAELKTESDAEPVVRAKGPTPDVAIGYLAGEVWQKMRQAIPDKK